MDEAQQAANSEEKSTAGDKYDTARAMAMGIKEMNATQLNQAQGELGILQKLSSSHINKQARPGGIVKTNQGNYYLAISAGPFIIENESWLAVSGSSPLGQALMDKKKGDTFVFRDKPFKIEEVY
jgi:hypothetical protein